MSTKAKTKKAKKAADHEALAADYLEGWQRARAELDNYRKATTNESKKAREQGMSSAITAMLPLYDNFQAVTKHIPENLQDDPWAAGVLHVARQFSSELEALGVQTITPLGEQFDPTCHEAVDRVKKSKERTDTIVEVVQPGYMLGDHVLRPAKVKVAA